jgi:TusA-related sulfurtransferase
MSTDAIIRLDLRGLKCPLPVLRTQKRLDRLSPGERVIVECTDPLSVIDIPHLIRTRGDILEETRASDGLFVFHIRVQAASD